MMFYLQIIEQYSTNVNVQRRMATPVRGRGPSHTRQMRAVSPASCQAGRSVGFVWPGAGGPQGCVVAGWYVLPLAPQQPASAEGSLTFPRGG